MPSSIQADIFEGMADPESDLEHDSVASGISPSILKSDDAGDPDRRFGEHSYGGSQTPPVGPQSDKS